MDPIEAALAALESLKPEEYFPYTKYTKKFSYNRITLWEKHRYVQGTRAA